MAKGRVAVWGRVGAAGVPPVGAATAPVALVVEGVAVVAVWA